MSRNKRTNLSFLSGLYTRVARQMGVHPSYVSRIARGERRSERVSRAIASELSQLAAHAGAPSSDNSNLGIDPESRALLAERIARRLKANPRLRKLSAMTINVGSWGHPDNVARVSRTNLQGRIAGNAGMIAAAVEHFHRLSSRLEKFPHVLSLIDADGIVLYSYGTTGMIRQEGRIPGSDWSSDRRGPSAAARAIASGLPVTLLGTVQNEENLLSARVGCPVRLSNREVIGVLVLSLDAEYVRAEHLLDLCKICKKLCKPLESTSGKRGRNVSRSPVQPFEEAELHLARVLSLPQLDASTRAQLAALLAELETSRRELLLSGESSKTRRGAKVHARGVS
jgi:transcriptional regulator with XRE-family HTH domain